MVQRVVFLFLFSLAIGVLALILLGKIPTSHQAPISTGTIAPVGLHASCKADTDCPAPLSCEVLEEMGEGVAYPNDYKGDMPSQQLQRTILKAECRSPEGVYCSTDEDCTGGLTCHQTAPTMRNAKVCTRPRSGSCTGPSDTSCPGGYTCVQGCGPPLARGNEPPPLYYCEINELAGQPRNCPICLALHTIIATPKGDIPVENLKTGMQVWSMNEQGKRVAVGVLQVSQTSVPQTHRVMHVILADGRTVRVSPGHPTASGIPVEQLRAGQGYDGSRVVSNTSEYYQGDATYDLLPDSATHTYWANGILFKSTLKP